MESCHWQNLLIHLSNATANVTNTVRCQKNVLNKRKLCSSCNLSYLLSCNTANIAKQQEALQEHPLGGCRQTRNLRSFTRSSTMHIAINIKHRNLPNAMLGRRKRRQTFCSSKNCSMAWWTAPSSVNSINMRISKSWQWFYTAGATQTIKNAKSCPANMAWLHAPRIFDKANLAKGMILQCTLQSTERTTTKDLPCPILPATWFTSIEIRNPLINKLFTLQTMRTANLYCIRLASFLQYDPDWNVALPSMKVS